MTETADTTQDSAEAVAYFAGGCFWGLEEYFRRISGVTATRAGYAQSKTDSPSYEEVCSGRPDAAETVEVSYDPSIVSLTTLTRLFMILSIRFPWTGKAMTMAGNTVPGCTPTLQTLHTPAIWQCSMQWMHRWEHAMGTKQR